MASLISKQLVRQTADFLGHHAHVDQERDKLHLRLKDSGRSILWIAKIKDEQLGLRAEYSQKMGN